MRAILGILVLLAVVVAFFVAIVAADDRPATCPPMRVGRHGASNIASRDLGRRLSCAQVRHVLRRWIALQFPERVGSWRLRYSPGCDCHVATREGARPAGFTFT